MGSSAIELVLKNTSWMPLLSKLKELKTFQHNLQDFSNRALKFLIFIIQE